MTTAERAASLPDVPTIGETIPGDETQTRNAPFAPAGTPPEVVERLNAAAMADPAAATQMAAFSAAIIGASPDEPGAPVTAKLETWRPVVADADMKMA